MKKIFTLLTLVFLANSMLFGQCPDLATPNPTNKTFNLSFLSEADRDAAWAGLGTGNITFPAGDGCMCGATVALDTSNLVIDGPVGGDNVYRIRAITTIDNYFGGENGNFMGDVTFINMDGTTVNCSFGTTSVNDNSINERVKLFPNPVKDQFTLINGKGNAAIFNVLGQPVKQMIIDADQATIQLADLLNGQYYLRVLQADGITVIKKFSKVN